MEVFLCSAIATSDRPLHLFVLEHWLLTNAPVRIRIILHLGHSQSSVLYLSSARQQEARLAREPMRRVGCNALFMQARGMSPHDWTSVVVPSIHSLVARVHWMASHQLPNARRRCAWGRSGFVADADSSASAFA